MVGGKIIGLVHKGNGETLVHVEGKHGQTLSINVYCEIDLQRFEMELGDQIWWQCGQALWTPSKEAQIYRGYQVFLSVPGGKRQGIDFDIVMEKRGYSH